MSGPEGPFAPPSGLELKPDVPLAARTTLRIGGPARFFADVKDVGQLQALVRWTRETGLPLLPLGKGSNLLVPDAGFPGVVFTLSGELIAWSLRGETLRSGGGVSLMALAQVTRNASLSGLENLSGIPSTLGGAIRINAGAYGSEIFDLLVDVTLVDPAGDARTVPAYTIPSRYRWSGLVESGEIVAAASLRLSRRPREEIEARLAEVRERRQRALPQEPNAGSVFKNPEGEPAGKLLEACGLKGRRVGGAEVSERHANVVVNRGGATEADVRALMTAMRDAVADRFGVVLEPELVLLGGPLPEAGASPRP